MNTPKRIQRKRTKGFRLEPNTKCVNRGTKYGNPYKVVFDKEISLTEWFVTKRNGSVIQSFKTKEDANKYSIELFNTYCELTFTTEEIQKDLQNKNLACFCSLDVPCHADYLLEIANQ